MVIAIAASQAGKVMRHKYGSRLRAGALGALETIMRHTRLARLSYVLGLHGRLRCTQYKVTLPGPALTPLLRIAFASDFHAGVTTDARMFDQCIAMIQRAQPHLLVLGGDYIFGKSDQIDQLTSRLCRVSPALGTYAVWGNHDLWGDQALLRRHLESAGIVVLRNQTVHLPAPYDHVSLFGTDDPWMGCIDSHAFTPLATCARILLTHSPEGITAFAPNDFHLALAGHTHGGQIAWRPGRPLLRSHGPVSAQCQTGRFTIGEQLQLIVGRGVGCSNLPIRIHADPEVIIIDCEFSF